MALIGLLSLSLVSAASPSLATGMVEDDTSSAHTGVVAAPTEDETAGATGTHEATSDGDTDMGEPVVPTPAESEDAGIAADLSDSADPSDGPAREASSGPDVTDPAQAPRDEESFEPLAARVATDDEAVITVTVGGDRSSSSGVAGLKGVTLRLHDDGANGRSTEVDETWAECTTDASGICSFTVPQTQERVREQGQCLREGWIIWPIWKGCVEREQIDRPAGINRDRQFWIVQDGAPSGWYANDSLVTGGTSHAATPYRVRTGTQLRAGNTYRAGTHFMTAGSGTTSTGSGGTWQVSRANPPLTQTCEAGIDVALVLDLSGSVANARAVDDLKASAIAFAEALSGTSSRLALFTFADTGPRNLGASGRNWPDLIPVDGNLRTIRDRINDYSAGGGTNWDRGIWQVEQNDQDFDLAIVITDGLATYSGSPATGPGSFTRFLETEQAIFSANALKEKDTRVLAVGVGDGISGRADNLRAISGPVGYTAGASANAADYFQTGWRQLTPLLANLAKGATCQSTVTVNKLAKPYAGQLAPAAGWTFAATVEPGEAVLESARTQTTDAAGSAEYTVQFDHPEASAATVRIEELVTAAETAEGWQLQDVVCTVNDEPRETVTEGASAVLAGLVPGDAAECTFTNVQTRTPGVTIVKEAWDVPSAAQLDLERGLDPDDPRRIPDGAAVTEGRTVTWTYTVTNTGQTHLTGITVIDDEAGPALCREEELRPGGTTVCTASGDITPTRP